ncbi:hypothetical protein SELMODRAFT_406844 [Selaginella moellendorffii]|uniref:Uncharacterized protein CYP780A6P n=1 Tax=Selaginella moellendorffii TaxID=88036 RepID=D8R346_SELML|nr:hypothetical protein SELMODRAFT_406844 [Selaginella moellendorffii]
MVPLGSERLLSCVWISNRPGRQSVLAAAAARRGIGAGIRRSSSISTVSKTKSHSIVFGTQESGARDHGRAFVRIVPSEDAHQSEFIAECFTRRAYVSGFTGSAGTAVITLEKAALWTDGRYYLQDDLSIIDHWCIDGRHHGLSRKEHHQEQSLGLTRISILTAGTHSRWLCLSSTLTFLIIWITGEFLSSNFCEIAPCTINWIISSRRPRIGGEDSRRLWRQGPCARQQLRESNAGEDRKNTLEEYSMCVKIQKFSYCTVIGLVCQKLLPSTPEMIDLMRDVQTIENGVLQFPIDLPFSPYRKALQARLHRFLDGLINERRAELAANVHTHKDALDEFITHKDDKVGFLSNQQVEDNLMKMLFGGHHTTALALMWLIKHLNENPQAFKEVEEEQRRILLGKSSTKYSLTWEDTRQMPATLRVVD